MPPVLIEIHTEYHHVLVNNVRKGMLLCKAKGLPKVVMQSLSLESQQFTSYYSLCCVGAYIMIGDQFYGGVALHIKATGYFLTH